ncbi:MAG: sigma-70 family RNA polymerase sigma factor [Bacteroidales bacterium]|nr:sigma-70 family RNA polymerase sigma factor [Bacteroidales bacterium]
MCMTDDKTLSELCSKGDGKAREELYRRYSPRLLSLCMRYMPDYPSAEDAMHDAFVRILESIGKYRWNGEGSLYSWMARVTINWCFDSVKKRRRIRTSLIEDADSLGLLADEGEDDVGRVPAEQLVRMVEELPEGYRTVFKLFVIDGLSHKEIGKLLKIKEKSSASNLARARAILAAKIKEYESDR